MNYILDGREMKEEKAAHEYIGKTLGFPRHYGKNLDALFDCLGEMENAEITVINVDEMFEGMGQRANDILGVFDDASNEGFIELKIE